jgi:hypothetical protein
MLVQELQECREYTLEMELMQGFVQQIQCRDPGAITTCHEAFKKVISQLEETSTGLQLQQALVMLLWR